MVEAAAAADDKANIRVHPGGNGRCDDGFMAPITSANRLLYEMKRTTKKRSRRCCHFVSTWLQGLGN